MMNTDIYAGIARRLGLPFVPNDVPLSAAARVVPLDPLAVAEKATADTARIRAEMGCCPRCDWAGFRANGGWCDRCTLTLEQRRERLAEYSPEADLARRQKRLAVEGANGASSSTIDGRFRWLPPERLKAMGL